jgi:CRP/FNR family transcriptional regulator
MPGDTNGRAGPWGDEWDAAYRQTLPLGAVLYAQGDRVDRVLLIERGMVKLMRVSAGGHRMVAALRASGWVLGAAAAILGVTHRVTAEAATGVTVRAIDARDFLDICRRNPAVNTRVMRMLSQEVHDQLEQTMVLALGARQRLLRLLARLAEAGNGHGSPDATHDVTVALRHREIAEAIWTTRETVTRLLRALDEEGVATLEGRRLHIPAGSPLLTLLAPRRVS